MLQLFLIAVGAFVLIQIAASFAGLPLVTIIALVICGMLFLYRGTLS